MKKSKHKYKHKDHKNDIFNFSFSNNNVDIRTRNFKIFDASIRALIIYLFLILPIFAYTYIVFKNPNVNYYINYESAEGKHIWEYLQISNGFLIKSLLIAGYVMFALTVLAISFFKPIITGNRIGKVNKYIYIVLIAILAIVSILLFGLSQYEYSRFYEYYEYSVLFEDISIKQDWAKQITQYFIANRTESNYGWASSSVVLWIIFVQIMLSFLFFVILQNSVFSNYKDVDNENYVSLPNEESNAGIVINNRFFKRWKEFFKNDQRNLAVYMIIGSVVLLLSNVIYSILITDGNTNMSSLISWNYRIAYLFTDLKGFTNAQGIDGYEQVFGIGVDDKYYGTLFIMSSLQIISLGLTISVLFFFITIFIRSERVSYNVFYVQIISLFVLLLFTISTMLVSRVLMYRMEEVWNTGDNSTKFLNIIKSSINNSDENLKRLFNLFAPNDIFNPNGFYIEWLSPNSNIADGILSYAFVLGLFIIVIANNERLKIMTKDLVNKIIRRPKKIPGEDGKVSRGNKRAKAHK